MELVADSKAHIVTTLIHKFDKALSTAQVPDESEIFVLVDETQRTQLGVFRQGCGRCFQIPATSGFTGTPLLKRESDVVRFGGIIHTYAINRAVADGAIVHFSTRGDWSIEQNRTAIDVWFGRHTEGLTPAQKADLKRKYARAMLNKADQVIYHARLRHQVRISDRTGKRGFRAAGDSIQLSGRPIQGLLG